MQYKIPVQIENEDKIFLNLGIRQLSIIMAGSGIGYAVFKSLWPNVGESVAAFPAIIIVVISVVIALFRHTEMTFLPFILNLIRMNLNTSSRTWCKWIDSYPNIEIGYVRTADFKESGVNKKSSHEVYESVEDKLHKL